MVESLLIVGYGNSLRGDDGAGPAAAELLARRGFQTLAVHQLLPELAERIAAAQTVIFLDADAATSPGEARLEPVAEAPPARPFEHHAGPGGLLRLCRMAYGTVPEAWIVRLGGSQFEIGEGLSADAERAVRRAVELVQEQVDNLRAD